jgi:hypothetical protein
VSKVVVLKLGLKTEKHPALYEIGWIKRGTETLVTPKEFIKMNLNSLV